MPQTMTVDEAAAKLPELVDSLRAGDEVVLTQNDRAVAKLVGHGVRRRSRQPGNCKGMLIVLSEDEDHLADFKDYMP